MEHKLESSKDTVLLGLGFGVRYRNSFGLKAAVDLSQPNLGATLERIQLIPGN